MVYFSAFQFKKRKEPALFSEKADSQAQEHSLKALCTPAVLVLAHCTDCTKVQTVSGFLIITLSGNMEPNFLSLADH